MTEFFWSPSHPCSKMQLTYVIPLVWSCHYLLPITCKVDSKTDQEIKIPYVLNLTLQGEWNYDCPSVVACRELKIWMIIWRFYSNSWAESLENEK